MPVLLLNWWDVRETNHKDAAQVLTRHEFVLNAWEAGWTDWKIAKAAGYTIGRIGVILWNARKRGDPRAVYRRASSMRRIGEKHGCATGSNNHI